MSAPLSEPIKPRLLWIDITKGISILWIVAFHFFIGYAGERYPWPLKFTALPSFVSDCAPASLWETLACGLDGLVAALFQRGSQPVGVFVVLSGFGLTYGLALIQRPEAGWLNWYRRRLLRLFPMYWLAHLVCLISPFLVLKNPIDWRFAVSFMGNRVIPADVMFYYLVPAWWFFGLLVELYLVFPVLYVLLRRLTPVHFLVVCAVFTILSRYVLQDVLHAHGNWSQGAFFGARLWEFAAGMVLAYYYRHHPGVTEGRFFSGWALLGGVCLYVLGSYSYQPVFTYTLTDAFIGMGLFVITAHVARWVTLLPGARSVLATVGAYSYGLYLLHQPYVMACGELLRPFGMAAYVLLASVVVAFISAASIVAEKWVNRLSGALLDRHGGVSSSLTATRR